MYGRPSYYDIADDHVLAGIAAYYSDDPDELGAIGSPYRCAIS